MGQPTGGLARDCAVRKTAKSIAESAERFVTERSAGGVCSGWQVEAWAATRTEERALAVGLVCGVLAGCCCDRAPVCPACFAAAAAAMTGQPGTLGVRRQLVL